MKSSVCQLTKMNNVLPEIICKIVEIFDNYEDVISLALTSQYLMKIIMPSKVTNIEPEVTWSIFKACDSYIYYRKLIVVVHNQIYFVKYILRLQNKPCYVLYLPHGRDEYPFILIVKNNEAKHLIGLIREFVTVRSYHKYIPIQYFMQYYVDRYYTNCLVDNNALNVYFSNIGGVGGDITKLLTAEVVEFVANH